MNCDRCRGVASQASTSPYDGLPPLSPIFSSIDQGSISMSPADEDDIAHAVPPPTQWVKGKENVAHDAKVWRPTRHTKTFRPNDTEDEGHQPKCRPPKKGRTVLNEREESSPDVDSESDVQPVRKRQNRGIKRVSSTEVSSEEIKPEKLQAPMNKAQRKVIIEVFEFEDD
jgi:hypothetical protein